MLIESNMASEMLELTRSSANAPATIATTDVEVREKMLRYRLLSKDIFVPKDLSQSWWSRTKIKRRFEVKLEIANGKRGKCREDF